MPRRSIEQRIEAEGFGVLGAGHRVRVAPGAPKSLRVPLNTAQALLALSRLTERQFQAIVRTGLEQRGYLVYVFPEMRLTRAGWPDLAFWHPKRPGLFWYWELKRQNGVVSSEQQRLVDHLVTVPGIDARIVRPADWLVLKEVV